MIRNFHSSADDRDIRAMMRGKGSPGPSAWSNIRFFSDVRQRQQARANSAVVEVTEVQASRVMDIEPLGNHGPAPVFFAGDGKALLLVGQWLLCYRSFPSTSFRLHQRADTKRPIRIETTGPRVTPEHSTAQLRASYRLTDIEVFPATPVMGDLNINRDGAAVAELGR